MSTSTARRPNADTLLHTLPNAELIEAVNGRDPAQVAAMPTAPGNLHRPHYPFPLAPGEIGCFLSHRRCWQKIVDGQLDYALIVEDDAAIDAAVWPQVADLIDAHAGAENFIRLPAKMRERPVKVIAKSGASQVFVPRVIGLQTVCQVVGRTTAQRLLAASTTLDRPVDTLLQMHWVTQQPVLTIYPNGISERTWEVGGSTIQKKTRPSEKLAREFKRAVYRAQVNARPQTV